MAKEDMLKKVRDGKIQQVMSKREREEAAIIKVGGKKSKNTTNAAPVNATPAPQKKQVEDEAEVFANVDISLLKLFTLLKVSPPQRKEQLDPNIEELNAKLKFFNEEGEKRLKEEEEKLLAGELIIEEEETKEHHEDFGGKGGYRGGRGGRGNFRGGRGGRGGNGRAGTAAGGTRQPRESEDNDVYVSSDDESTRISGKASSHQQTAGGKRQKKEDLNLDDNNYPTL
jgi:hypothetical protein